MRKPGRLADVLAHLDRRAVWQDVSQPRGWSLVAEGAVHRAAMVNDHGTRGYGAHGGRLRVEPIETFDGIGFLCAAMQSMRQHAEQVRAGYVGHRAIVERTLCNRDPNAQFVVVKAGLAKRFVLMPRRGMAGMTGFENR